jgi:iron complex outermembrane receptor protein
MTLTRSDIASVCRSIAAAVLAVAFLGAAEASAQGRKAEAATAEGQAAPPQVSPQPASSPQPQSSPAAQAKDVTRAEDVTVTARRREENVQKVPLAITVKAGNDLVVAATADLSELQGEVPNLSIYAGRNQSTTLTAFMRGVGQADPLWGVDPGVGLYVDDVYLARPQGALLDIFDVQRIEVLRGPQGTLYGKNTIGGAIKYVSRDITDKWQGLGSFTGGSYSNNDFRASIGGPLIEGKLRARVAGGSFRHSGYGTNLFTGKDVSDKDTQAIRGGLDWLPSTSVKVQMSYDQSRDRAQPKGLTRLAANALCPLFSGGACPPEAHIFDTRSGLAPLNSTDAKGSALNLRWTINPEWKFRSITAYRKSSSVNSIDFDTTPGRIADVTATYSDHQTTQEFQLLHDSGKKLSGILGAYYLDGQAGGVVKNIFVNSSFGTTDGTVKTSSIAGFLDGSYHLSNELTLNAGARLTSEKKTAHVFNAAYDSTFSRVLAVAAAFDKDKTFSSFAPRLGLDYAFRENVMGYVAASRGFKSGGFNVRANTIAAPGSDTPFKDEVLDVAEVGVKSVLNDHKLVLNAAAFYGKYKDVQVSTFTTVNGAFFGQFLNAGNARIKGVEVEFDASSVGFNWLSFSGQGSYLGVDPDPLDNNHDGFVDTQVITNAPKFTGALRATGRGVVLRGLLVGSVGVSHRDDSTLTNEGGQYPGKPGTPLLPITQKAYRLWDAYISWLAPGGHVRVAVNGKNLANQEYLTNGYNIPSLGILQGAQGNPRTVTGTIELKF